jgi:uncharacterized protein YukE
MAHRFEVDPDRIRRLGATFSTRAADLRSATAGFESRTTGVEEAFGLLGPSTELYHEYLALARDSVAGLAALAQALADAGAALATTADNYRGADAGSVVHGAGSAP